MSMMIYYSVNPVRSPCHQSATSQNYWNIKHKIIHNAKAPTGTMVLGCPEETKELRELEALVELEELVTAAISPDGAAVAIKLFQAATVAVGKMYVDCVVPAP